MQATQRRGIKFGQQHRGERCAIESNKVVPAALFNATEKLSEPAGFPNLLSFEANDSLYAPRQASRLGQTQPAKFVFMPYRNTLQVAAQADALLIDEGWQRPAAESETLVAAPPPGARNRSSNWFPASDTTVRRKRSRPYSAGPSSWPTSRSYRSPAGATRDLRVRRSSSGRWSANSRPAWPPVADLAVLREEVTATSAVTSSIRICAVVVALKRERRSRDDARPAACSARTLTV